MSPPGNTDKGWTGLGNFPLDSHRTDAALADRELLWLSWFLRCNLFIAMANVGSLNPILCWHRGNWVEGSDMEPLVFLPKMRPT